MLKKKQDITDPNSMQDACHIRTLKWALLNIESLWLRSAESEGLRFDSSEERRIFSSFYACDRTKNIFPYITR